jgi:signal peptidase I
LQQTAKWGSFAIEATSEIVMAANQIFLIILAIAAIASFYLHVASVKWGVAWANVARISWLKALGLTIVFTIVGVVVATIFVAAVGEWGDSGSRLTYFIFIGLRYAAACLLVAGIYRIAIRLAAKAVVPYLATSLVLGSIATFLVRTFAYEAFTIPTNSMAPTLLGEHLKAHCPDCGSPGYGMLPDLTRGVPPDDVLMVCSKELKSFHASAKNGTRGEGDCILVCKLVQPKRWDLIEFRAPPDPSVKYVKRLVGLPGEKLAIHDGAIWINGEKMEPPDCIRGIRYSPTIETNGVTMSGPGSVPIELGPDEYFVLGDFVDGAYDSRFWEKGAPGHPPYAVPLSYVDGVVINVYWPPSRWKSFR